VGKPSALSEASRAGDRGCSGSSGGDLFPFLDGESASTSGWLHRFAGSGGNNRSSEGPNTAFPPAEPPPPLQAKSEHLPDKPPQRNVSFIERTVKSVLAVELPPLVPAEAGLLSPWMKPLEVPTALPFKRLSSATGVRYVLSPSLVSGTFPLENTSGDSGTDRSEDYLDCLQRDKSINPDFLARETS
jgi:hypothetical protein